MKNLIYFKGSNFIDIYLFNPETNERTFIRSINTYIDKNMKRQREFLELTFVWSDKRKKNSVQHLELKETRLINQMFEHEVMECIEVRVKDHFGTREEFDEKILRI